MIRESLADLKKQDKLVRIADKLLAGMRQTNTAPIVLPQILKTRKGSDMLNSVLSAKGSIRWRLKQCQEACNLGSVVVVLSLCLVTMLVIVASHFLAMETCAHSVNSDTVLPVVWQDCPSVWIFTQRTLQRSGAFKQLIQSVHMSKNLYENKPSEETTNN